MGYRLSKIYTRTGDAGTTGLGDGSRMDKDDPLIEAMGTVDELNSSLGWLLVQQLPQVLCEQLVEIQHDLFDLGGELCMPGHSVITEPRITGLEQWLDAWNEQLSPLREFILPGGTEAAAAAHVARTICRRAERRLLTAARAHEINPQSQRYLNRLSDYLFVIARVLNWQAGQPDVLWRHDRGAPSA